MDLGNLFGMNYGIFMQKICSNRTRAAVFPVYLSCHPFQAPCDSSQQFGQYELLRWITFTNLTFERSFHYEIPIRLPATDCLHPPVFRQWSPWAGFRDSLTGTFFRWRKKGICKTDRYPACHEHRRLPSLSFSTKYVGKYNSRIRLRYPPVFCTIPRNYIFQFEIV